PERRYASAAELADELGRFLRSEPVLARPVGRFGRAWRWCKRNPVAAGLTALVAALLLAGTGVSTYLAIDATRAKQRADDSLYVAHMSLAQIAHERGNIMRTRELLQLYEQPGPRDPRAWEWYYLTRLCQGELRTLPAPSGFEPWLAFNRDGSRLYA